MSALISLEDLLSIDVVRDLPEPAFLYCGAAEFLARAADEVEKLGLPEMAGLGVGDGFLVRLTDPVLGRSIEHEYAAIPLGDDYDERKDRGASPAFSH